MNQRFDRIAPGKAAKIAFFLDLLMVTAAFGLAIWPPHSSTLSLYLIPALASIVAWVFAAAILRLYSPCTPRNTADGIILKWMAALSLSVVLFVLQGLVIETLVVDVSRFFLFLGLGVTVTRLAFGNGLESIDEPLERVLIVGTGPLARVTYQQLSRGPASNRTKIVGFLSFENEKKNAKGISAPILGTASELFEVMSKHAPDEVYLAGRVLTHGNAMQEAVRMCEEVGMPFAVPLHSLKFERATLLSSSRGRDGYLHYMNAKAKPMQYGIKRLADIMCSSLALVVLSPLLLGVAAMIKASSKGPILFKQERVGLNGSRFSLLKFRSMVINAEELKEKLMAQNEQSGPVFKMTNDPRITGIGRFIRKFSIDELPQLLNILRGDMTIVGPRPALPKEVALYKPWQRRRLSVRPGLTCYWQVGGRNEIGFDDWMRMDLRYVDHWNLAIDAELILKTFPVVLTGRGAS